MKAAVHHRCVAHANGTRAAELERLVILADANEIAVAVLVNLQRAREEHAALAELHVLDEIVVNVIRLGPARGALIGNQLEFLDHRLVQHVGLGHGDHHRHVRAPHQVRQ